MKEQTQTNPTPSKKKKKKSQQKKAKPVIEKKEEVKKDAPPLKSEDYQGWKDWYRSQILKGLEEGKEEAQIAFELNIQPASVKAFLS